MATHYKGERITELLNLIKEMEDRLKGLTRDHSDFYSQAQYEEVAHGYTSLALAKAKLLALQGEGK
jgi:hypothetical protein